MINNKLFGKVDYRVQQKPNNCKMYCSTRLKPTNRSFRFLTGLALILYLVFGTVGVANAQIDHDCDNNGILDSNEYEVIKLDFASGGDGEGGSLIGWNTIQGNTVPSIVDQTGDPSTITVGLINFLSGSYTENDPADGWPGMVNDPYYIPAADDIYFHGDLNNDATITFGGLDPTLKYNVRIYSLISDNGGKTQTFNVAHGGGTASSGAVSQGSRWAASTLEAGGTVFSNLMANGSNELVVTIDPTDPDPFYALNAIVLECQRDLDGDGVSDACDLDDDNDGILDVDEQACTEQLDNPGFDGVPIGSHRYPPEILPGWTLGSGGLIYSATTSQIEFFDEADGSNTFKQTISQAGLEHLDSGLGAYGSAQVIIDLRVLSSEPQTGGLNSFLDVRVGGVLYAQINTGTDNTSPANAIVTYFNGASGNLSTIPIDDRGQNGGVSGTTPLETWIIDLPASVPSTGNFEIHYDPSSVNSGTVPNDDFELHRASVITCFKDTDLDGIPDYQDLDSDGDGCPDAVEGGGSFTNTSPPLVTDTDIPGGSTGIQDNLGTSSNADGTPTAGTQSVGESANAAIVACPDPCDASASGNPDLDSDNVSDICDLDDDNDGITDEDEGSCVLDTDLLSTYTVSMSTQPATTALNGGGPTSGFASETDTSTPDELSFTTTSPGETSFDNNDPHKHGTIAELDIMLDRDPSETLQDASLSLTTGGFDDGLFLTVNGVTVVNFDQCDWHNLAAVNDVYGDAVNGSGTGTDLWQPWFAEGNPELVFSVDVNGNATVELLVTQNDGVTRTNILDAIPGSTNPIPQVDFEAGVTLGIAYQNGGDCTFAGNGSISPVTAEFSATFCSPLDTDLDGIPDYQDLDSDGDGCPDAIEGDGSYTSSDLVTDLNIAGGNSDIGDGLYNGTINFVVQDNLGDASNVDGTPTAGATQGIGTSTDASFNACNTTNAEDDINQTPVDTPVDGNIKTNDSDPEGHTQTITLIDTDGDGTPDTAPTPGTPQDVGDGTIDIDPVTGDYTFTPDTGFTGTVEIPYETCDDGNPQACDTAVLVIEVTGPDGNNLYPPIAQDDNAITEPDTNVVIPILSNDSDPDGTIDPATVTLDPSGIPGATCDTGVSPNCTVVTVPNEGTYTVNPDGTVTFDPEPNFEGETTPLPYTVCDNDSLCDDATITVMISNPSVNETTAEDDANSGLQDVNQTGNILDNDIDPEGDTQTVDSATNSDSTPLMIDGATANPLPSGGTIVINPDGTYTYDPEPNFIGTEVVVYTVCDDGIPQACDTATLYLTTVPPPCIDFTLWVYLEGSLIEAQTGLYNAPPMRTTLNNSSLLPGQYSENPFSGNIYTAPLGTSGQVYNIAPWNYGGTEGANYDSGGMSANADANYPSTVTDWVMVSLRTDPENGSEALCQRAGLLHSDGHIEFMTDADCCALDLDQSYYIVIEHRNHMIIMSATAVPVVNGTLTYDFRDKQSYVSDPFDPTLFLRQKEVLPGVFAMYAGNGDQTSVASEDTDITAADRAKWLNNGPENRTYNLIDYNMDGDVSALDFNLWQTNSPRFTSIKRD